jgi:pimeloyl-ACP methyl ester carboxylesterase
MALSTAALAAERDYTVTSADGVKIAVQETGDPAGAPIVFVHGLLGSHIDWDEQTKSRELQSYRLITYDMRGHGLSGKPEDTEAYHDGRRWADDLASVLKATGAKKPILVGWSLGGVVLSNYLAAHGDEGVAGLVYVDGVIELTASLITSHPKVYTDLASDDLTVHLDAVRTFLALCFQTQPDTATFERLLSNAALASWVMTKTIPSMTVAAAEGLPKAHVPVLMVYGGKDALVNPEPSIARAKALNSTIKTAVYANSGHAPFLEEAPRFNRDLAEFRKASTSE